MASASSARAARSRKPYVKDAFHRTIIHGERLRQPGRRSAPRRRPLPLRRGAGGRLGRRSACGSPTRRPADAARRRRRDHRPRARPRPTSSTPRSTRREATDDERRVQRQALAGLLWTKQSYLFDVDAWLDGDNPDCAAAGVAAHDPQQPLAAPQLDAGDVDAGQVGVPVVRRLGPRVPVRRRSRWSTAKFAKEQLWLLLFEQFQHPNGQIPAYEWEFSDLNPPVHAWAVWRVYNMDRIRIGQGRPSASSSAASTSC